MFCLLLRKGVLAQAFIKPETENQPGITMENGGFETLTGVPIEGLGCVECHDANDANGDPYTGTYTPDCVDCHATNSGTPGPVTQDDCLGCHGREKIIVQLGVSDVHRDASTSTVCWDCHGTTEMHGDGTAYTSMFDPMEPFQLIVSNCHVMSLLEPRTNDAHNEALHCSSCHMQTNLSCYNCHFESQVEEQKRAFGTYYRFCNSG